jgi:GH25 family lysozyme M1 (1,4-beta-N-acetylmuramidase)
MKKFKSMKLAIGLLIILLIAVLFSIQSFAATIKGIDVSEENGNIDWKNVKSSDVEFAIIQCGYGDDVNYQDDETFRKNVEGCIQNGIPYGIYFYSYAEQEKGDDSIEDEIKHAKRLLKGYDPFCVYLQMDEDTTEQLGSQKLTKFAMKFCDSIRNEGFKVGVYEDTKWFN